MTPAPVSDMIKPWTRVSSTPLGDYRIFTLRSDRKISPRTHKEHDFFVIDCVNWVNVIALTPARQLVMVEQFRHGSNSVELEIPGGMIDPADANPEDAAVRELREETGYVGRNARVIGKILPNPAFMSNTCYTVLIEDCRLEREVQFDHAEDIVTQLAPVAEIPQWVASGKIRHALVVVALYHFELLSRNLPKSNAV